MFQSIGDPAILNRDAPYRSVLVVCLLEDLVSVSLHGAAFADKVEIRVVAGVRRRNNRKRRGYIS